MLSLLQKKIEKQGRLIYSNNDLILFRSYFPAILHFIFEFISYSEVNHYSCKSAGLASLRPIDSANSPLLPYNNSCLPLHSFMDWCIWCRLHLIFFTSWISERRLSVSKRQGHRWCPSIILHRKLISLLLPLTYLE